MPRSQRRPSSARSSSTMAGIACFADPRHHAAPDCGRGETDLATAAFLSRDIPGFGTRGLARRRWRPLAWSYTRARGPVGSRFCCLGPALELEEPAPCREDSPNLL